MGLSGTEKASIGAATLDWPNLGFEYRQTNTFVVGEYKNGHWDNLFSSVDPHIKVHIGATALHYGQACFEGLKAFHCKDGNVRIFRPKENAARIAKSCKRICMPELPEGYFLEAVTRAVRENLAFLPPYGTGGALYIRPVLFGTGPRIGLQPSDQYTFVVMVMPAADYYRGGWNPVQAVIVEDFDRAAPRGVGNVKVAGNYAADILPNISAKKKGFPIALYLDSKSNSFLEEFSTSNFIAIDKNGKFITPKSDAILESVTNKSLMQIATDEGHDVQQRPVPVHELCTGHFTEIGACGTAVVVTPIDRVVYKDIVHKIGGEAGVSAEHSVLRKLYRRIRSIQSGEEVDKFHWMVDI
jgi:branched-chain amino acid aminotransferase